MELSRKTVVQGVVRYAMKLALSFDKHQRTSTANFWSMTWEKAYFQEPERTVKMD